MSSSDTNPEVSRDEIEAIKGALDALTAAFIAARVALDAQGFGNAMREGMRRSVLTASESAPRSARQRAREGRLHALFDDLLDEGDVSAEPDSDPA